MSGSDSSLMGWVLAGVATVIATLAGAVATLFKIRENENAKAIADLKASHELTKQKSDKCEEDRNKLFTRCEVLEVKLQTVEEKLARMDVDGTQYSHRGDK